MYDARENSLALSGSGLRNLMSSFSNFRRHRGHLPSPEQLSLTLAYMCLRLRPSTSYINAKVWNDSQEDDKACTAPRDLSV